MPFAGYAIALPTSLVIGTAAMLVIPLVDKLVWWAAHVGHFPHVNQWVWVSGGMAVGLWAYVYFLGRYTHLLVADQLEGVGVLVTG